MSSLVRATVREQMANSKTNRPSSTRPYVTRSFVIPVEQDIALKRLAQRNHRTFSGELRLVVENHLAAHAEELESEGAA